MPKDKINTNPHIKEEDEKIIAKTAKVNSSFKITSMARRFVKNS